jgi:hypothetical protein
MKENMNSNDAKLSALLRESRLSPSLPPRFQESVWRRIKNAEAPIKFESWLNALVVLILRPRFAFTTAAMLLFAGVLLGTHEGTQTARHDAQARYLAAVAPNSLR